MIYISFRFDDCHSSQYHIGFKLLKKYNMVGSFYAVTNLVGKKKAWPCNSMPYINFDQLREILKQGSEIGCHSKTHKLDWVDGDDSQLKYELCTSLYDFRKNNIFPKTFCFPYTKTSEKAIELCNKNYDAYLAKYSRERIKKLEDNFIQSLPTRYGVNIMIDAIKKPQDSDDEDEWLVLTIHEIIDNPSIVGIKENQFIEIIDVVNKCVQNKTHKVVTVIDGFNLFKSKKNANQIKL